MGGPYRGALVVYADGMCLPKNPGGFGCWAWVAKYHGAKAEKTHDLGCLGHGPEMTVNRAAYEGALQALRWLKKSEHFDATLLTDSELIVKQLTGRWCCRDERYRPLYDEATALVHEMRVAVKWIPHHETKEVWEYVRCAYDIARAAAGEET